MMSLDDGGCLEVEELAGVYLGMHDLEEFW